MTEVTPAGSHVRTSSDICATRSISFTHLQVDISLPESLLREPAVLVIRSSLAFSSSSQWTWPWHSRITLVQVSSLPPSSRFLSDVCSAIAASAGTLAAIGTAYILPCVGFCAAGVMAGSVAAGIQASFYGANVPAGGAFASLQSWGTMGALTGPFGAFEMPVGIAVACGTYIMGKKLGC